MTQLCQLMCMRFLKLCTLYFKIDHNFTKTFIQNGPSPFLKAMTATLHVTEKANCIVCKELQ